MQSSPLVVVLCSLFALAVVAASANTCQKVTCSSVDGPCGNLEQSYAIGCKDENTYCEPSDGASGYFYNGTCVNSPQIGDSCGSQGICTTGSRCIGSTCQAVLVHTFPGEVCIHDSQCIFYDSNFQLVSKCVAGKCFGLQEGDNCSTITGGCVSGLYCDSESETCVASLPDGASCGTGLGLCLHRCILFNDNEGVCGASQTVGLGGVCSATYNCISGLICKLEYSTDSLGTCGAVDTSSDTLGQDCNTDDDCLVNEYCQCNMATGNSVCTSNPTLPENVDSITSDLTTCLNANDCVDFDCMRTYCLEEQCASYALYKQQEVYFNHGDYCSGENIQALCDALN